MLTEEFKQRRNDLILFIFSAIAFGALINLIANFAVKIIPEALVFDAIYISIVLTCLLIVVTIVVISPSKEIREEVECYFFHDLENGLPIDFVMPLRKQVERKLMYHFTFYAHQAFAVMINSGEKDILKDVGKPRHFSDFMICAIICWLKNLHTAGTAPMTFWRVWKERGKKTQEIRDEEIKKKLKKFGNVFADKVLVELAGFYIPLPENCTFEIEKDKVIIKNRKYFPFLTVEIGFRVPTAHGGLPESVMRLLEISPDLWRSYATVEAKIIFYARFGKWAILSPDDADVFQLFVKELVQHLKQFYSWPLYEKGLKDYFYWKHIS